MSIKDILLYAALLIATIAVVICVAGLLHILFTTGNIHMIVHELERWLLEVAWKTALTVLATAGVVYIARKS